MDAEILARDANPVSPGNPSPDGELNGITHLTFFPLTKILNTDHSEADFFNGWKDGGLKARRQIEPAGRGFGYEAQTSQWESCHTNDCWKRRELHGNNSDEVSQRNLSWAWKAFGCELVIVIWTHSSLKSSVGT